jgi:CelD/BcsL family acetyltransferase involved in cellulose biosynthesis
VQTSATAARPARIRVLRHLHEIDDIADRWDELASSSGCPTGSAAWTQAAASAFGLQRRLRVVVVECDGRLEAIAPLVAGGSLPGAWRLIGMRQLAEPADFLARDEAALERLTATLARLGAPLHLARVPADSATLPLLRSSYRGRGLFIERTAVGCPRILLDSGWEEPEGKLESNRRQDVRRARRRAEALGPVRCEILAPQAGEVKALLDEAYRVEATGWKGRQRTALAFDAARGAFFRRLAMATARRGWFRLAFLHIGDQRAAMHIALETGGSHWVLKVGYDERFQRCSPGTLLTLETIRHAARAGLLSYEFLGTDEPWLRAWTREARACASVRAHPPSFSAMVALGFEGARSTWHKAWTAIRPH